MNTKAIDWRVKRLSWNSNWKCNHNVSIHLTWFFWNKVYEYWLKSKKWRWNQFNQWKCNHNVKVTDFFWNKVLCRKHGVWSETWDQTTQLPVSAWTHITQTVTTIMVISGLCYIALIVTRSTFVAFDSWFSSNDEKHISRRSSLIYSVSIVNAIILND